MEIEEKVIELQRELQRSKADRRWSAKARKAEKRLVKMTRKEIRRVEKDLWVSKERLQLQEKLQKLRDKRRRFSY